ncbi:MAG: hypothetical protein J7J72_10815 [Bacteroidales bacterium]|nr:hypothetical protein [Bacteroidales bacterium]
MKKLVFGIIALAFVLTVSLTLNAQTDGTEKIVQTQKVEKKKECKTTCDKTAKKECTAEAKATCNKVAKKECCKGETKAACDKTAKKEDAKK